MKITLCAYDAPHNIDGPTVWLKRLLPFLRQNGIEIRLLFFANNVGNLTTLQHFKALGFACKLVPLELFFEEQIRRVLDDLCQFPPDVFIPNYFPAAGYAAGWVAKAGLPSVMVLHNDDAKHRALVEEFSGNANALSCVVPVSEFLREAILPLARNGVKIETIPCGAPLPAAQARWDGIQPLKLVYFGRLNNHQKKIDEVAKAFCRVTNELPNVEAVIHGNGPALESVLQILSAEGNKAKVSYGGAVQATEIQTQLLKHHVFVLLSAYEGIPISLMEAMGCGLVPVCTDIKSGVQELVQQNETGKIVANRGDAFFNAIKALAEDPATWKTLSDAARKKVESEYSDVICNAKWLALLNELASQNSFDGTFEMPSVNDLRRLSVNPIFLRTETRMPSLILRPIYRLKKQMGRLKRIYQNEK